MMHLPLTEKELKVLERVLDDRQQIEWVEENAHNNEDWFNIVNIYKKVLAMKGEEK
jgi:hypothetical protein